jgi:MFS family permease
MGFPFFLWCATRLLHQPQAHFSPPCRSVCCWNDMFRTSILPSPRAKLIVQGIMYLAAPLLFAVFQRWPHICRKSSPLGLAIVVVAIALSSFATSVWHLILTQGVLYAVGGGLLYYPVFLFIDEWFVQRKGFAYGVMWAGSGCGGLSGPLVINWGLSQYGHQKFLRGWAVALVSHV